MLKKIGIDIRSLLEKNKSGVGEYTCNLLEAIFKLERENEYFLFYNSFSTAQRVEPLKKWNFPNVHFRGFNFPNRFLNTGLKFFKYPKIDKLIKQKLNSFLIPNLDFISLSKSIKKIVIVHDLSYEIYPKFFSLKSRLWHKIINPKKLYKNSEQIIAVSENTAQDLNDIYNIPRDKIKVIYPGVKKQIITESDLTRVKQKYNLPENYILYLGNIEPRKNIEGLIEAFRVLKLAIPLLIAGSRRYKSKHLYKNNYKNIKFLGYVPNEDRTALYKSAKLFVFPSYYEGFGFPPLEAMAQGTPVISSISSSLVEIIGNAGILIDPYNINELSWGINEMLSNQKLRENMIQGGYERVKIFEWENTAKKIIEIL